MWHLVTQVFFWTELKNVNFFFIITDCVYLLRQKIICTKFGLIYLTLICISFIWKRIKSTMWRVCCKSSLRVQCTFRASLISIHCGSLIFYFQINPSSEKKILASNTFPSKYKFWLHKCSFLTHSFILFCFSCRHIHKEILKL